MKVYFPSITICTGTYNPDLSVFIRVLESIKYQNYPDRIEHIIYDGASSNGAPELARKYGCRVLVFKHSVDEGGSRLYRSLRKATGELVVFIESDNILTSRDWLVRLAEPFKDKRVFATFSWKNAYDEQTDVLNRYFALIGAPDPTLYYLKKSDKIPMTFEKFDKGEVLDDNKKYSIVRFTQETLPTTGDNGFMIRREILDRVVSPTKSFVHTDALATLLRQGFDTYGVVKNSVIHISRPNILDQVKRRVEVKRKFTDEKRGTRVHLIFNWNSKKDWWNLIKYIFFTLTIVETLWVSIRGYRKIRDIAWFLHPAMCLLMVFGYGWSEIEWQLRRLAKSIATR